MRQFPTIIILLFIVTLSSCKVFYPNMMFRGKQQTPPPADSTASIKASPIKEYVIRSGDRFTLEVFTNDGYEIISVFNSENSNASNVRIIEYLVKSNGYAKLPLLDSVKLSGLTLTKAEDTLQTMYKKYFLKPFARVNITNRRAFLYIGSDGGRVITLKDENMTLLEVLASGGGLKTSTRSHRIKILRGDPNYPEVIRIDLSTMEGLAQANLGVIANDLIYVEPTFSVTGKVLSQLTPILGIFTSVITIYFLATTTKVN